jgi:spore coat protein U-like protein
MSFHGPLNAVCAVLVLLGAPACAVTCSVSTSGPVFGAYDPFSLTALDSAGDIAVTCSASVPYTVALGTGVGSYPSRQMSAAGHLLLYNLYTDASRVTVWGDGSAGSAVVSGNLASAHHPVYGQVPARQNVPVGAYGDGVTITVVY